MKTFIVTIKGARNPVHNPHAKVTGPCRIGIQDCTDSTGEHHSFLVAANDFDNARRNVLNMNPAIHITRIESATLYEF